jgi:hypothetical protein
MRDKKQSMMISFFGGPGSAKSIMAAHVFALLKWEGVLAELSLEYVKTKLWENSLEIFNDQIYIFGKQYHSMFRLHGKVDVIVTDSPFLLGVIYDKTGNDTLAKLIIEEYKKLDTFNVFLERDNGRYESTGRFQDLEAARQIDDDIKSLLVKSDIPFKTYKAAPTSAADIASDLLKHL